MYVLCFPFPSFSFLLSARMVPVWVPAARHNHLLLFSPFPLSFNCLFFIILFFLHCTLDNTIFVGIPDFGAGVNIKQTLCTAEFCPLLVSA